MPEGPEVETEGLHEAIHEELEKEGGRLLKAIALSTALLAAVAAIAALKAGATVNEALVLKTTSTRKQAEASDQWAYYQAKGVKAAVQEASASAYQAAGKEVPAGFSQKQKRYTAEQEKIQEKAHELEKERDELSMEADHLLHQHHGFAHAVAIFQVAIALAAVSALTRIRLVWFGSLGLSAIGIVFVVLAFFGKSI